MAADSDAVQDELDRVVAQRREWQRVRARAQATLLEANTNDRRLAAREVQLRMAGRMAG